MLVFLSISGLIFLFLYFTYARLSFMLTCYSRGNDMNFAIEVFVYLSPIHKHLVYRYKKRNLEIISAIDQAVAFAEGLKKRSEYRDMKAYLIRLGFYDYRSLFKIGCKYVWIEEINWKSQLGFQDAMYTGIIAGITWAVKGVIISLISTGRHLEKLYLKVDPIYGQETFATDLHCIIKMRIVHIIFIAAYMLFKIVRGYLNGYRPGKTEPSHRRAYENGYAKY